MELRNDIGQQGAVAMVVTELDQIAWLLNLRGKGDSLVESLMHSPTFQSMLLVYKTKVSLQQTFILDNLVLKEVICYYFLETKTKNCSTCFQLEKNVYDDYKNKISFQANYSQKTDLNCSITQVILWAHGDSLSPEIMNYLNPSDCESNKTCVEIHDYTNRFNDLETWSIANLNETEKVLLSKQSVYLNGASYAGYQWSIIL